MSIGQSDLETLSLQDLYVIASQLSINPKRRKSDMISDILTHLNKSKHPKTPTIGKYKVHTQLGNTGKEGTTYLVSDRNGQLFAMKTFKRTKSSNRLEQEYLLQEKASHLAIAPKVYEYDTNHKYIVMEKMDEHLYDRLVRDNGFISKAFQERIIEMFKKVDDAGVFHNDANLTNYMIKNDQLYLIDYGFSKPITPKLRKELGTDYPNYRLMLIGFLLKLRSMNVPYRSYKYLLRHVNQEDKIRFRLE